MTIDYQQLNEHLKQHGTGLHEKTRLGSWKAQTPFPVEFLHNGARWALTIYAVDEEDAKKKVESLKESATLVGGPIVEVIDVS